MTNHAKVAEIFPEAYQGKIQMSDKEMTIIEAATFRGLPALFKRYGEWVITKYGIDPLAANSHIAKDRLDEYDWIKHLSEKTWVNILLQYEKGSDQNWTRSWIRVFSSVGEVSIEPS